MNLYPETNESGSGKSGLVMYPTPGLKLFCTLAGTSVRGMWVAVGRWFAVSGTNLYEIFSNGTFVSRGTVANDSKPVSTFIRGWTVPFNVTNEEIAEP